MLDDVLKRSRELGFLGPGSIDDQIGHSGRFGAVVTSLLKPESESTVTVADIGAGGGVPSLPVLVSERSVQAVLIDASQRRCSFLVWAGAQLELADRMKVWCGRVEEIAHQDRARARFDIVVARGFGPPAATAECAAGLLRPGGHLVVSEPPDGRHWPSAELSELSLEQVAASDPGFAVLRMVDRLDDAYPRPHKVQQRQPLF